MANHDAGERLPRISVFGLGKLGAVLAACHASRGYSVIGYDVREEVVKSVRAGVPPVTEPELPTLFHASGSRLTATNDPNRAVVETDVTLLAVPTPSLPDGSYALDYVLEACQIIGKAIAQKERGHLVVLKSTVMPGASEAEIVPALERASSGRVGIDFGYCYNPEFIALGSVARNVFRPDLVLIGESDEASGRALVEVYQRVLHRADAPIARMSYANAELAKVGVNSFVTMKITFANLLAQLCERLPGGDADQVTAAIGLDSRIGTKYLKPGLGFGGPCFPRDNQAVLALARQLGVEFGLAAATDAANAPVTLRVADLVAERVPPGTSIALLGLSYKPHTPVVEESQSLLLASALAQRGFAVRVFDPQAIPAAREVLGESVEYAKSMADCLHEAGVVVVGTAWPEFEEVDRIVDPAVLIIDCWGQLDGEMDNVLRIGRSLDRLGLEGGCPSA